MDRCTLAVDVQAVQWLLHFWEGRESFTGCLFCTMLAVAVA
jgi:hypothetical protein